MGIYDEISFEISRLVTIKYSTSFSMASSLFDKNTRRAIHSIYGFVRFADEIVDTFHDFDKKSLLESFENDYLRAVQQGISLNPVLHSFQDTIRRYRIPQELVMSFLTSMKADLVKNDYSTRSEIEGYIYGSADVVGLMCLKVFCNGNDNLYLNLEKPAMKLGSAFQKVNFLRDLKNDMAFLGRRYFPEICDKEMNEEIKLQLVNEIEADFDESLRGIRQLPGRSRLAVLAAYYYYRILLHKIKRTPAQKVIETRIRISNPIKIFLLFKAMVVYKLKLV